MAKESRATSNGRRALKITGIALGAVIGVVLIVVLGLNSYVHVAFAPFYEKAEPLFPIPGINSGFIPQDSDHVEADDSWLFSGYMTDHSPSPLYRRTSAGDTQTLYVALPDGTLYDGHGSAITSNERYAYLSCEYGYLVIPIDNLVFAEDGDTLQAVEIVALDFSPAFMNIEGGQLFAGEFYYPGDYETPDHHRITSPDGTENPSVMYAFAADDANPGRFSEVPDEVFSIPGMVQGTCMTDSGSIVLSTSFGIATSHLLAYRVDMAAPDGTFTTDAGAQVPLFCLDSRNLVSDLAGPPMLEGIESHDGRIITLDEAASNKYIFGKLYGAGQVYAVAIE